MQSDKHMYMVWHTPDAVQFAIFVAHDTPNIVLEDVGLGKRDRLVACLRAEYDMV